MAFQITHYWTPKITHYWTPKIQGGEDTPFWKSWNHHISRKKSSNFDKICYRTAHLELNDSHMTKYKNFKNSRWRMAAILKIVFWPKLSSRFQWNLAQGSRIAWQLTSRDIISKFQKFMMADCGHIVNHKIAVSRRKIVRFWWHLVHNSAFGQQ